MGNTCDNLICKFQSTGVAWRLIQGCLPPEPECVCPVPTGPPEAGAPTRQRINCPGSPCDYSDCLVEWNGSSWVVDPDGQGDNCRDG
jgi:hypothetical protein